MTQNTKSHLFIIRLKKKKKQTHIILYQNASSSLQQPKNVGEGQFFIGTVGFDTVTMNIREHQCFKYLSLHSKDLLFGSLALQLFFIISDLQAELTS